MKSIASKNVYNHYDVETLELRGYAAIKGLFDCYKLILELPEQEFCALVKKNSCNDQVAQRLFNRLPKKHLDAYSQTLEVDKYASLKESSNEKYRIFEWYYRARLLIDFISGMTDDFAIQEYQTLSAI